MATETLVITVCDVCESTEDITTYEVRRDGSVKRTKIDLCGKDRIPLENLITQAPKPVPGRRRTTRVTSIEEIDALKKKPAKKATAKKTAAKKTTATKKVAAAT